MASVKRKCCCDFCNCTTCGGVQMPKVFDVLVQGVAVVACSSNLAAGIGDPNGQWQVGCHQVFTAITECRWDTRAVPVSGRIYTQPGCAGFFTNYATSYTAIAAINGSGTSFRINASSGASPGDGPAFFTYVDPLGTCQLLRGGIVVPNQAGGPNDVGTGGTATITPHNPMP